MSTPVVFPYEPDGGEDFIEAPAWSTDILAGAAEREQRIARRGIPLGSIEMMVRALEPIEMTAMMGLLYTHHQDLWHVPLWQFALPTSADLSGGETVLPVDPPVAGYGLEVVPWQLDAGEPASVLLYRSSSEYQVLDFLGIALEEGWGYAWGESWGLAVQASPPGLLVAGGVEGNSSGWGLDWGGSWGQAVAGGVAWPAGTLVIPLRLARLDPETASSLESLEAVSAPLRWVVELAA